MHTYTHFSFVCVHVLMYACMYVCLCGCVNAWMHGYMPVWTRGRVIAHALYLLYHDS